MRMNKTRAITVAAALTALGIVVPMIFHATQISGQMFLPMHIPVLLCGIICGPFLGAVCAVIVITVSSAATGMPPLYPQGLLMVFELIAYAVTSGVLIRVIKRGGLLLRLYIALIAAMLVGRGMYGLAAYILLGVIGNGYTFTLFLSSAFVKALPGIIIQLISVPPLVLALKKARLLGYPPFTAALPAASEK